MAGSRPYDPIEISVALRGDVLEQVRAIAFEALSHVVLGTPVGNPTLWKDPDRAPPGYVGGHARRNWQVGIASAPGDEIEGVDPSGGAVLRDGRAVIAQYPGRQRLYIVNNAPYIGRLNDGWSTQAPPLFVEAAIDVAIRAGIARKVL